MKYFALHYANLRNMEYSFVSSDVNIGNSVHDRTGAMWQ
jgi:hypothetical protein